MVFWIHAPADRDHRGVLRGQETGANYRGAVMKTYAYSLKVTKAFNKPPTLQSGTVSCKNFNEATKMALDTECMPWEEKRALRELVSLVLVCLHE